MITQTLKTTLQVTYPTLVLLTALGVAGNHLVQPDSMSPIEPPHSLDQQEIWIYKNACSKPSEAIVDSSQKECSLTNREYTSTRSGGES